jgi:predicted  nucleic acid-binding Zn-ribbon protein
MKAAQMTAIEHGTGDVWRVGCDLERELNAAKIEIEEKRKDVVWLATEKAKLEERIKRLEEACGEMVSEEDTYIRLQTWLKAKEAKP